MGLLTLDQIAAKAVFASERVEIPALGGEVLVRDIAGAERDRIVQFFHEKQDSSGVMLKNWEFKLLVLSLSLCHEDGSRLIPDDRLEVLGQFGGADIEKLYDVAARISGLAPVSPEDATKNSESGQSLDSGSDSQPSSDAP